MTNWLTIGRFCAPVWGVSLYGLYCFVFGNSVSIWFYLACFVFFNTNPFHEEERFESPDAIAYLRADVFCRRTFLLIEVAIVLYDFILSKAGMEYISWSLSAGAVLCIVLTPIYVCRFLRERDDNEPV